MTWKGIAQDVLDAAGVWIDDEACTHLPCRNQAGDALRARIVSPTGNRWWGPGEGVHLFGLETLPSGRSVAYSAVFVTEGESDALAAREALDLYDDARSNSYAAISCPGARAWRAEWRALLEDFALVYVIGDGDDAGRGFAWSVRRAVPWARPVICPEGRDLRNLLQSGDPETVLELLDEADYMARLEDAVLRALPGEELSRAA